MSQANGPVKRVLLLTHKAPEVTASALPGVLSLFNDAGVELLVPEREARKTRAWTATAERAVLSFTPGATI